MIHELGHAILHSEGSVASREVVETEVESVAFVVCDAIGLNTGNYSFPYVARWAGGPEDLIKDTASRVIECAKSILGSLGTGRRQLGAVPAGVSLREA